MGTLIYYTRAVESNTLVALVYIADNQYKSNKMTAQAIKQLLDYYATHLNTTICYKERDMVLCVHSDGSYL